jgi:zinc transporter ZupT
MSIQWGRILLAAFLMELVLVAIAIPLTLSGAGGALTYVIPPASFVATFAITVWLGRRFTSRPVLHGALIGVAGSLMYVALTRAAPEPWPYLLAHALKVAGGAAGGLVLAGRPATTQFAVRGR